MTYYPVSAAVLAFAAALGASTAVQAAGDNQLAWEGFLTITSSTAQCASVGGAGVGSTHASIYRPKIAAKDTDTYLSILQLRAAQTLLNTDETFYPQFQGPSTYAAQAINGRAKGFKYNGTTSFSIVPSPAGPKVTASTVAVTITGTIDNFFNVAGCTIGVQGAYVKRID